MNIYEKVEGEFSHEHTPFPTKQEKSNGVVCVVLQCSSCGERIREVSKSLYNVESLPWFDESLREMTQNKKHARRQELMADRIVDHEEQSLAWWDKYNAYLKTPQWAALRRNVIRRDNCKCQNCFRTVTEEMAHVHHTSYVGFNRLGYSYAFECVTLCRNCHTNFHIDQSGAAIAQGWR